MRPPERLSDLPGRTQVRWRSSTPMFAALACLAGAAWPPLVLTLPIWPPANWTPGLEMDWRLIVLAVGLVFTPAGLYLVARERDRRGRPSSRLGIVWRFLLYGGAGAAALQIGATVIVTVIGWFEAGGIAQAAGASETTILIYGVGGLPIAILVGVSYALWAGLCCAFIAFEAQPEVRDRLGLMGEAG
ncbi:MAG: phthalate transporter [Brevundimonas sp.]